MAVLFQKIAMPNRAANAIAIALSMKTNLLLRENRRKAVVGVGRGAEVIRHSSSRGKEVNKVVPVLN
jgi:hypothetical protein